MPSIVVIGSHWGDEGKGKIVDLLAQTADVVVRFSGGDNAGHTVVNSHGSFGLHMVPAGIFSKAVCVIGNGVAVNPESLLKELDALAKIGIDVSRLRISDKAHLVMPYHLQLDGLEEAARGDEALGTTKRGIGPTYADKAGRIGIRAGDLLDLDLLSDRLSLAVNLKNEVLQRMGGQAADYTMLFERCKAFATRLGPLIEPTEDFVNDSLDQGKTVIFEGAQATLLDIEFGTYPQVTSSPTTAAGVYTGGGVRPRALDCVLGVFKAYTTRVGAGAMPTELTDEIGDLIRKRAHEFGVTTGRPRRCGWLDGVAGRYSVKVNGMTGGALTRLDVLDDFNSVKLCVAYKVDGKRIERFPAGNAALLRRCEPIYEEVPGWKQPTSHLRTFDALPAQAKAYVHRLEEVVGCKMDMISVGPRREESITVRPLVRA